MEGRKTSAEYQREYRERLRGKRLEAQRLSLDNYDLERDVRTLREEIDRLRVELREREVRLATLQRELFNGEKAPMALIRNLKNLMLAENDFDTEE